MSALLRQLRILLVAALALALATAPVTAGTTGSVSAATAAPTLAQMIGQKLMVRMTGTTPTVDLLGRIQRGEVGGVILFGSNIVSRTQVIGLTTKLRAAAKAGGQPTLLIAVDQEGGSIKRIPWAPPTLTPPQMGRMGSASVARDQGALTGAALQALGINVDLAPVADVPHSTSSFMYLAGRTWSFDAVTTATLTNAFAAGLESKGVVPVMKHFPGLGYASKNTDQYAVRITASRTSLLPGLRPYRTAIANHIPMIMLSNAAYSAYDPANAAGWSPYVTRALLRHDLGFAGVSMTDSLDGTAHSRGLPVGDLAVDAAQAGTDIILTTGSETTTSAVYARLLREAQAGTIFTLRLRDSYDRIMALKAAL